MKEIFPGVYTEGRKLYTKNLVPGKTVYGEYRIRQDNIEYREWNPTRSKTGAALFKGIKQFPIEKGSKILYLGIANGTTASHFSDIIGKEGYIIGIDIAPKMFEKLLEVCGDRENIIPILADANRPDDYKEYVTDKVDVIYEDVAQKNQTEILVKNIKQYLKQGGYGMIAVKARSIDVTKDPDIIFRESVKYLENEGLEIIEKVRLQPYEKDHMMIIVRKP